MEAWGAPQEYIDQVCAEQQQEDVFELWPENVPVVTWFLEIGTQWRIGGLGNIIGLDYNAIAIDAKFSKRKVTAEMWQDLKLVERVMVTEMNKRPAKNG